MPTDIVGVFKSPPTCVNELSRELVMTVVNDEKITKSKY